MYSIMIISNENQVLIIPTMIIYLQPMQLTGKCEDPTLKSLADNRTKLIQLSNCHQMQIMEITNMDSLSLAWLIRPRVKRMAKTVWNSKLANHGLTYLKIRTTIHMIKPIQSHSKVLKNRKMTWPCHKNNCNNKIKNQKKYSDTISKLIGSNLYSAKRHHHQRPWIWLSNKSSAIKNWH